MKWNPLLASALVALASPAWAGAMSAVTAQPTGPVAAPADAMPESMPNLPQEPTPESTTGMILDDAPAPPDPGWQPAPKTTAAWADRCTDFTINGWAFKDPANFSRWLEVFSDPGIYLELASRAMEPEAVTHSLGTLLDPSAASNYAEWANPVIYDKWAAALSQPDIYTRNNAILFDPGKLMNWVMLPLDPRPWKLLGTAMNPAQWVKWMTAPFDPKVWAPLLKQLPEQEWQAGYASTAAPSYSGIAGEEAKHGPPSEIPLYRGGTGRI